MSEERTGDEPEATDDLDPVLDEPEIEEEPPEEPEPDEPEEGEPEPEPEGEPPQAGRQRADNRIQSLSRKTRQLEEQNRLLMQRLLAPQQPAAPAPDPARQAAEEQAFYERIAMLPPQDMAAEITRRMEQRFEQRGALSELRMQDRMDRMEFQAAFAAEPAASRLAPKVEETLAEARKAGMNPSRMRVYEMLLGAEVRQKALRDRERQTRTGQRRTAAQTVRPAQPRGDATPQRRRGNGAEFDADAFEREFGDMAIEI